MNISNYLLMFRKISQSLSGAFKKVLHDTALFEYCGKVTFLLHHRRIPVKIILSAAVVVFLASPVFSDEIKKGSQIGHDLTEMSIEDLMNIQVTIASREPEKYFNTPAAIYVITSEVIQRSGATSVPELLRLAPGVDVERIDSNKWAVTIRGTASRMTRTVLVMIDGRSVYSPVFGGVYWEDNDLLLEDIDRIEIVRGPGGSYWGTNAISGIVNVITKKAKDTQGGLVTAGIGSLDKIFGGIRYGGKSGNDLYYRVYAKYFERDGLNHSATDRDKYDEWRMGQVGFRIDKDLSKRDALTVQGDFHSARIGLFETGVSYYSPPSSQTVGEKDDSLGGNILTRWQRKFNEQSNLMLQLYYDKSDHRDILYNSDSDIVDLDFQHSLPLIWRQKIIWGMGYRFISSKTSGSETSSFSPEDENFNLYSAFIQDDLELVKNRFHFILGAKFEHNDVTGLEIQPNARLLWTPNDKQTFWASVSRAVRTPSRIDYEYTKTTYATTSGGIPLYLRIAYRNNHIQDLLAYELGHRIILGSKLSIDTAVHYDIIFDTPSLERNTPYPFPEISPAPAHYVYQYNADHKLMIKAYGGEISVDYKPFRWWRLSASESIFRMEVFKDDSSTDPRSMYDLARIPPRCQTSIQSYLNLPGNVTLDLLFRYVDEIPTYNIPSYYGLDARLGWKVTPNIELSVVGQNLLDNEHPENSAENEIPRSFYLKVQWQW